MKKDTNHVQIIKLLASLDTRLSVIQTKQEELIRRVGIQNGRVADSEAAIKKIVGEQERAAGARNAAKYIVGIILTISAIIAAAIFHP